MVAHIFQNGDKAYIIDNVRFLREVIIYALFVMLIMVL